MGWLETLASEAEFKDDVIEKWGFDHLVLNMTEADDEIHNALAITVEEILFYHRSGI